jgi:DNA-binding GntR family transcriptional regulator
VGRTAIRQALNRLAGQGLVVHVPRCGWRVRPFDAADLCAYLEVRESLELKALDLARPHLVAADLERMRAGNIADARSPRLDNDLHRYLVEKAGNPYIRDFFDRHGGYYTALLDYAAPGTRVVTEMAGQHRAILEALIDRDWLLARRLLAHHIRAQQPIVEELMRRIGRSERNPQAPEESAR